MSARDRERKARNAARYTEIRLGNLDARRYLENLDLAVAVGQAAASAIGAYLVKVHPGDRVELWQTRGQMREQARLVQEVSPVGRIDDGGDYVPLGKDAATGEWRPVGADDVAEFRATKRGALAVGKPFLNPL